MELPRPPIPDERLDGWAETEATVEEAFSTPIVTVHTHTVVYEETEEREAIQQKTGIDLPWRFFFSSRIRLEPQRSPSKLLTSLIRRKAVEGFTNRLADRGFEQLSERTREEAAIGDADGLRVAHRGVLRHDIAERTERDATDMLTLPVAAMLAVWAADGDYHVAGGGYPADRPDSGPGDCVDTVAEIIDPRTAQSTLRSLIDSCGPTGSRD